MRRWCFGVLSAFMTLALGAAFALPAARACDEEGPGLVQVRIKAAISAEDAAKIVVEQFENSLVLKNIRMTGEAAFRDGETELLRTPVVIQGLLLTVGDKATFAENRGILWMKYTFSGAGGAQLGTGEGFVTLEQVRELEGKGSFQGTINLETKEWQFAGTGESEIPALLAKAGTSCPDCEDEDEGLVQEMDNTVLTLAKPGFFFESASNLRQLNKQFVRAKKQLGRSRLERLGVLRHLR